MWSLLFKGSNIGAYCKKVKDVVWKEGCGNGRNALGKGVCGGYEFVGKDACGGEVVECVEGRCVEKGEGMWYQHLVQTCWRSPILYQLTCDHVFDACFKFASSQQSAVSMTLATLLH